MQAHYPMPKSRESSTERSQGPLQCGNRAHSRHWRSSAWWLMLGLAVVTSACSDDSKGRTTSSAGGSASKGGSNSGTVAGANDGGGDAPGGNAGASAAAGATTAGSAGQAGANSSTTTPICITPAEWVGAIKKPSPRVSIGKPVTTNAVDPAEKAKLTDGLYNKSGAGFALTPTTTGSTWASIDVGPGFSQLLLTWRNIGDEDYGPSLYSGTTYAGSLVPLDYSVKTSGDSTDGNDGTWTTVATVTGNQARSRSHVVKFVGQQWVRFEVTGSVMTAGGPRAVRLDEIELYDLSNYVPGDYQDTWFVMGDSITKMGLDRNRGANEIDQLIAAQRPGYSPALVLAGNGGETLVDALRHLESEEWLKYSEGLNFVTLAFGTNDSWGSPTPASSNFEGNLRRVIEILKKNGRVPVLVRIPWNSVSSHLADFNAVIDRLQVEHKLPCGPDLYQWFAGHQDQLINDHVHPKVPDGANAINQQYAQALLPLYSTGVAGGPSQ